MATHEEEVEAMVAKVRAALTAGGIDVVKWDEDEEWLVVYDPDSEHEFAVTVGGI